MLCQSCGQRPASVKINQTINGRMSSVNLCHICAEERAFFGGSSLFDAFFGNSPFGPQGVNQNPVFPQPQQQHVNIVDFFSERAKKVVSESANAAAECKAKYIDTEHLLLGLLEEGMAR